MSEQDKTVFHRPGRGRAGGAGGGQNGGARPSAGSSASSGAADWNTQAPPRPQSPQPPQSPLSPQSHVGNAAQGGAQQQGVQRSPQAHPNSNLGAAPHAAPGSSLGGASSTAAPAPGGLLHGGHLNDLASRNVNPELLNAINGLNPIVGAAQSLFALYSSTRQSPNHRDVRALNQTLKSQIQNFEATLRQQQQPPERILAARYIACSLLDEAVLNTPWGMESPWAQYTLLSAFHKETSGGEKVFQILEHMRQQPAQNRDMLEYIYVCLSLGFEGRYRFVANGRQQLEQIRMDLYQLLKRLRPDFERDLSAHWRGFGNEVSRLRNRLPLWVVFALAALLALIVYGAIQYQLVRTADPVVEQLDELEAQLFEP